MTVAIRDAARSLAPPPRPVSTEPTNRATPTMGTSRNVAGARAAVTATSKPSDTNRGHASRQRDSGYGGCPASRLREESTQGAAAYPTRPDQWP